MKLLELYRQVFKYVLYYSMLTPSKVLFSIPPSISRVPTFIHAPLASNPHPSETNRGNRDSQPRAPQTTDGDVGNQRQFMATSIGNPIPNPHPKEAGGGSVAQPIAPKPLTSNPPLPYPPTASALDTGGGFVAQSIEQKSLTKNSAPESADPLLHLASLAADFHPNPLNQNL